VQDSKGRESFNRSDQSPALLETFHGQGEHTGTARFPITGTEKLPTPFIVDQRPQRPGRHHVSTLRAHTLTMTAVRMGLIWFKRIVGSKRRVLEIPPSLQEFVEGFFHVAMVEVDTFAMAG
jgi:hypothetical protein